MAALASYAGWRMTRRAAVVSEDPVQFVPMAPAATTPVTMGSVVVAWEDQIAATDDAA